MKEKFQAKKIENANALIWSVPGFVRKGKKAVLLQLSGQGNHARIGELV